MFNPQLSLYKGVKDTTGETVPLQLAINTIASDELSNQIYTITHELDDKKRNTLKSKLPAVTWSGRFTKRSAKNLIQHSGLICLDFDKLKDVSAVKKSLILQMPDFVVAVFVSPSGNGLKVVCRVHVLDEDLTGTKYLEGVLMAHDAWFRQLADFFKSIYGLEADESGKDVSRLCFLSWDLGMYVNTEAEPFTRADISAKQIENTVNAETDKKPKSVNTPKTPSPQTVSVNVDFASIRSFTDKKFTYAEGSRNNYLNAFVMNCKGRGIDKNELEEYCEGAFSDYIAEHSLKDLQNVIKSVYANSKIEFGKYKAKTGKGSKAYTPTQKAKTPETTAAVNTDYNEKIKFWYVVEKPDKETGEMKQEFKFDHDGLTFFLFNNGFRKIRLGEKGFQFIRLQNGLIEAVEPDDINHFLMTFLHKDVKPNESGVYTEDDIRDELHEVRKMYKRGVNTYTKTAMYTSLPELKPKFLRDNEKTAYLYFRNGYIEIAAESKTLHPYTDLKENIWAKQRKDFEIKLLPESEIDKSIINQFLCCAIVGEGSDDGKDVLRMKSMCTTIGYLLDSYKDPTNTKAPVFQDKKINSSGEDANGGSGKTLTAKMLEKMINVCLIDGKAFSFDAPYPYDTFRVDHKLIVYNDVNRKFPFENLFHKITEDFQFDRRYVDAITIPHEDAPKHLVITNYSLMGQTASFMRRQHIIEFSNYFDDEHTPKDEFKHRFFIDWDAEEWNRFYNFMIMCVQLYKRHGLVAFPAQNVKLNKLINEAGEEFIDWMDAMVIGDETVPAQLDLKKKHSKDEMFRGLLNDCMRYSQMKNSNRFTGWAKMWCEMRGYMIDITKSGRNYFWTFIKKEKTK